MGDPKGLMLNYQYKCTDKDCLVEFGDNRHLDLGLTKCPECGKMSIKRVFNSTFRSKGFYQNDGKSRLTG